MIVKTVSIPGLIHSISRLLMFFFSFESSTSNCHFNGFFIIIQSQCTGGKKYVRKRIKTEEASLAGDVYPSLGLCYPFHSHLSRLPR